MKTIKSVFLAVMLVCATSLSAAENPSADKTNLKKASEEIGLLLKTPLFEVKEDITAQVSLMVNDNNEIVVMSVETNNQALEYFVKARLNYQKLSNVLEKGIEYTLPVTVKSEN